MPRGKSMRRHSRRCWRRTGLKSNRRIGPLSLLSVALAITTMSGAAAPREFKWDELQKDGRLVAGTVLPPEPGAPFYRLKVDGAGDARSITVLTIDRPGISAPRYAL